MSKKLLFNYNFVPGSVGVGKIEVDGNIPPRKLLLITNTTRGIILYNFSDPLKGILNFSYNSTLNKSVYILDFDTSSMSQSDEIQIFFDDEYTYISPSPAFSDPVDKFRVSNPQSLIDTDFEYSLQPTKWETLELQNNIPGVFQKANDAIFSGNQIVSILEKSLTSNPSGSISPISNSQEGRSGMTVVYSGNIDDSNFSISLPFNITFIGNTYSTVFFGTNGYYTFGGGSSGYSGLESPTIPNLPGVKVFASDRRLYWLGYKIVGSAPNRKVVVRWEGSNYSPGLTDSHIYETVFYEGIPYIDLHYLANQNTGTAALQNGTSPSFILTWTPSVNTNAPYTVADSYRISFLSQSLTGIAVSVTSAPSSPFFVGQPIILKDTKDQSYIDGTSIISGLISTKEFLIPKTSPFVYTEDQKTEYTLLFFGGFFFSSEIPITEVREVNGATRVRITFASNHGLFVGSKIYVVDETVTTTQNWIGAFTISRVISSTQVEYEINSLTAFTTSNVLSTGTTKVYVRNEGVSNHRYFDGGVQINPSTISPNNQIIRQTRKYFRYQSGKGIQFSTGILFMPTYDVRSTEVLTNLYIDNVYEYYLMTIETDQQHGFTSKNEYREGASVRLSGYTVTSGSNPYNGVFEINSVINPTKFTVLVDVSGGLPTDTSPGGICKVEVIEWNDAVVRSGLFDEQNGLFLEHDGSDLYCVRRNSTEQIAGLITVQNNSSSVTGSNTKFLTQLSIGEYIVIKGQSYLINDIQSNTSLTITPDYKGNSIQNNKIVKTNELRVPSSQFSLDPLDGSGYSGYIFNKNKMQMIFIDYSWYGAGKVRYGMRGLDGNVFYFHEFLNNNTNTEAYMRSGNLPGRFEIQTKSKRGKIQNSITGISTQVSIKTADASSIPNKGRIIIKNEYIEYTKYGQSGSNTILNLNNRNIYSLSSGNVSAGINDTWTSFNQNCSPSLSHWGVSVMMDGRFDEDKSYLFTASNSSVRSVTATQTIPLITIRLSPSVDYGISGFYGEKNLINRSSLSLKQVGLAVNGLFAVSVRINCESSAFNTNSNWRAVGNGSIAQYVDHSLSAGTVTGGDLVTSFFAEEGSNIFATTTLDIDLIRELSNSILGGPNSYPDGPDTLTLFVTNFSSTTRSSFGRISWTEAQG